MKVYIVFFAVGLLSVMACSDKSSMPQYNVYQTNLDVSHELFTHQLSDEKNDYLFGEIEEDKRDYRTSEITIERSVVGDEKNWSSFSENIPGKCQAVCQTKKYVYLISRQQYQERQEPKYSKHKLYRISKEDGIVTDLYEWDKGNMILGGLTFLNDEQGYLNMVSFDNKIRQLIHTNDGGSSWSVFESGEKTGKFIYNAGIVYSLASKRNITNWIYSIEKKDNELDSLQVDLNITDFAVGENGDYWLLGKYNDRTVLQSHKGGKTTEIKVFSEDAEFWPNQLYKYNDVVVVLASKIDKSMLSGFGGTKPTIYLSRDNGLTWNNHSFDEALYLKPVSFYKDERMTVYIGNGKLLSYNLKE